MNLPVNWGDVPSWLEGVGSIAPLVRTVWASRRTRMAELGDRIKAETRLSDEQLANAVQDQDELAALVLEGIEIVGKVER